MHLPDQHKNVRITLTNAAAKGNAIYIVINQLTVADGNVLPRVLSPQFGMQPVTGANLPLIRLGRYFVHAAPPGNSYCSRLSVFISILYPGSDGGI